MKILCKLFGHRDIFIPDELGSKSGKYHCKRCNHITGGIGMVIITVNDEIVYYDKIGTTKYTTKE